jgi:hypothetical protein
VFALKVLLVYSLRHSLITSRQQPLAVALLAVVPELAAQSVEPRVPLVAATQALVKGLRR